MKKSTIAIIAAGAGLLAGYVIGFLTKESVKKAATDVYDRVTDFHGLCTLGMDDEDSEEE